MRLVFTGLVTMILLGCSKPDAGVVSQRDVRSPDGRFIASIVEGTSANAKGYDKHVSLRRAGEEKRPHPGNVWRFGPGDGVGLVWTSPTNLVVNYSYGFRRAGPPATNIIGVTVSFKEGLAR